MDYLISYSFLKEDFLTMSSLNQINKGLMEKGFFKFDTDSSFQTLEDYFIYTKSLKYEFELGTFSITNNSLEVYWKIDWFQFFDGIEKILQIIGLHNYINRFFKNEIYVFRDNSLASAVQIREISHSRELTANTLINEGCSIEDIWNFDPGKKDSYSIFFQL